MYCGSGVTACQNLLAMAHAGLPGARFYPARGPSGRPIRHDPSKKVQPARKPLASVFRPRGPEDVMPRALLVTAVLLMATASVVPAQRDRDRDRPFGLSQEEWCRQDRRADFCEVREETLRGQSTIDLDARGNGGVFIRGWDRSDVQMRARVTVWDDSRDAAAQVAKQITITTTGGRISADGPRDRRDRRRSRDWDDDRYWSVAFELQVPRKADIRADATNGGIVVETSVAASMPIP